MPLIHPLLSSLLPLSLSSFVYTALGIFSIVAPPFFYYTSILVSTKGIIAQNMSMPLLFIMTSIFCIWLIGISFCKIVTFIASTLAYFAREDRFVFTQDCLGYIIYAFHLLTPLSIDTFYQNFLTPLPKTPLILIYSFKRTCLPPLKGHNGGRHYQTIPPNP